MAQLQVGSMLNPSSMVAQVGTRAYIEAQDLGQSLGLGWSQGVMPPTRARVSSRPGLLPRAMPGSVAL